MEDKSGNIWFASALKLTKLTFTNDHDVSQIGTNTNKGKARSKKNFKMQIYSSFDGIKGILFHNSSVMLDSKNRIWWGSARGVEMLDMNNFSPSDDPPRIQMNSITINDTFMDFHSFQHHDSLRFNYSQAVPFYNYPENLELEHDKNHLTFHFSAIDWFATHKIKYSYKIDGLTDQWSEPNKESKVEYRNLPYGEFTIKMKAIGQSQKWSETFEYSFEILPPWWHTWWARIGYVITGMLLLMGFVKFRTRSIERQKSALESIVVTRTAEVVKQKNQLEKSQSQLVQSEKMASLGQLTTGIAHEINNPVSFTRNSSFALGQDVKDIKQLIEKYRELIGKNKQDEKEIEAVEKNLDYEFLLKEIDQSIKNIQEGTKRTSDIVKGLREFSHMDQEKMELADIHDGIDNTLGLLKSRINPKIKITKNYDRSIGMINCHLGQLNQVFLNIFVNALDAIGSEGEIMISTRYIDNMVRITIKDDGTGIPKDIINKIFDPFFTTKKIGEGTGLGLSISHGIIKNHGGEIIVNSILEKGAVFEISLPKDK